MHELSIAAAIVEIAEREARGRRVVAVEVQVGDLRQVVPEPLRFAFATLIGGTALDGARLRIQRVAAAGRCRRCGSEAEIESFPLLCAGCGSAEIDVVAGEELQVRALELEEEDMTGEAGADRSAVSPAAEGLPR